MEDHIKYPISELEVDEKNRDHIRKLMKDFEKLSPSEKLNVLRLQDIMLETVTSIMKNTLYPGVPYKLKGL